MASCGGSRTTGSPAALADMTPRGEFSTTRHDNYPLHRASQEPFYRDQVRASLPRCLNRQRRPGRHLGRISPRFPRRISLSHLKQLPRARRVPRSIAVTSCIPGKGRIALMLPMYRAILCEHMRRTASEVGAEPLYFCTNSRIVSAALYPSRR